MTAARAASRARFAFSLIEVLVVIGIVGLLVALTMSAVQQSREASRRIACASNLKQLGVAVGMYESTHRVFPPGNVNGYSAFVNLLPYVDQTTAYDRVDFSHPLPLPPNPPVPGFKLHELPLALLRCPSDSGVETSLRQASSNYAMNYGSGVQKYGYNGVFRSWFPHPELQWGPVKTADIRDGLSRTAALSEILVATGELNRLRTVWNLPQARTSPSEYEEFASACRELSSVTGGDPTARGRPWVYGSIHCTGYTHILGPNQPSCTNGNWVQPGSYSAGSAHAGGINVLFADGHVDFVSVDVDLRTWRAFGSCNGAD